MLTIKLSDWMFQVRSLLLTNQTALFQLTQKYVYDIGSCRTRIDIEWISKGPSEVSFCSFFRLI